MINRLNELGKSVKLPKPCKYCGGLGHLAFGCRKKPKKPLATKKRIRQGGKLAKAYAVLRAEYFRLNPGPDYYCYYCLFLGIEQPMQRWEAQVEHYHSKVRRPDLRFDMTNLVISCPEHNRQKGSLDGDTFIKKLEREMHVRN